MSAYFVTDKHRKMITKKEREPTTPREVSRDGYEQKRKLREQKRKLREKRREARVERETS